MPGLLFGVLLALAPTAAVAQVALGLTATSDARNRGLSLNGGRPAATATIAYDSSSGVYLGASATGGDTRVFGAQFLGHSEYLGYATRLGATRLGSRLTGDVGIVNTRIDSNVFRRFSGNYTEVYAGIGWERLNARILFAPTYIVPGLSTVYLDVNGSVRHGDRLRAFAHAGLFAKVGGTAATVLPRPRYDLRLGVAAGVARHEVQLAWVHTGAGAAYLAPRRQSADALVLGASWFF